MFDQFRSDLAFGFRQQLKTPANSLVIVVTLALGIAATSISFSLVNGFFIRPLPIHDPARVVRLYNTYANGFQYFTISYPDFEDMRALRDVFADAVLEEPAAFSVGAGGGSERIWGELVSERYFAVLGVTPQFGRFFAPQEESTGERVVVLSHGLWKRRFGADAGAVNGTLALDGERFRVVGVAPDGFGGTTLGFAADLWVPIATRSQMRLGDNKANRGAGRYFGLARLQPGVTLAQARASLDILALRLQREFPISNTGVRFTVLSESDGRVFPMFRGAVLGASAAVVAVAVLVLLIACANVAGVLMVRAAARRTEIGVRLALGATRTRIVAQLLTEAASLSIVAGGLGILIAWQATTFLSAIRVTIARGAPVSVDVGLDVRVLAASVVIMVATALVFGLAPALEASQLDLVGALKDAEIRRGLRSSRLRHALVAGQVALSMLLLAGGGLFIRSLQHVRQIDLGFDPNGVVTTAVDLRLQGYSDQESRRFWDRLLNDLRRLPRTQSVSVTTRVPLDLGIVGTRLGPEGARPGDEANWATLECGVIDPDYFRTLRIPLLDGRGFTDGDTQSSSPVIILNDVIAHQFWPGARAVGRRVVNATGERYEVVGVVRRSKYMSVGEEPRPYVYFPLARNGADAAGIVARGTGDAGTYLREIGDAIHAIAPDVALYDVSTMADRVRKSMAPALGGATALSIVALMALVLTSLGLYGTIAQVVSRRTYEIGVRRALGARDRDVVRLVVGDAIGLVIAGTAIGLAGGFGIAPLLRSVLYDVDRLDPLAFGVAPLVLLAVCIMGSWIPTWRAVRINAATALRYE
jgi:putative ABC transport system permease protein